MLSRRNTQMRMREPLQSEAFTYRKVTRILKTGDCSVSGLLNDREFINK